MNDRIISTYSMWSLFRNCRKAAHWRYVLELVPLEKDRNLSFGSLIHVCLETWHRTRDLGLTLAHVDQACCNRAQDEEQRRVWHLATAMMLRPAYFTKNHPAFETGFGIAIKKPPRRKPKVAD